MDKRIFELPPFMHRVYKNRKDLWEKQNKIRSTAEWTRTGRLRTIMGGEWASRVEGRSLVSQKNTCNDQYQLL